jgi:uncharacterized membrane protein YidH (DUF202 family)
MPKQKKQDLDVWQILGIGLVLVVLLILILFYQGTFAVGWTAWWEMIQYDINGVHYTGIDTVYVIAVVALVAAAMILPIFADYLKKKR